jgi:hypothetical protein
MPNHSRDRLNKRGHVEHMLTYSRDQLNKRAYAEYNGSLLFGERSLEYSGKERK